MSEYISDDMASNSDEKRIARAKRAANAKSENAKFANSVSDLISRNIGRKIWVVLTT